MSIDFSKVEVSKNTEYLKPGIYMLAPDKVEYEKPEGKTPYLNITFSGNEGIVKQKFYLTEKAFSNLQYLHTNMFGKALDKSFENETQVAAYFEKALLTKKIEKPFLVGGQRNSDGKVYCELPFSRFIINDKTEYSVGAFDPESSQYKDVVKASTLTGSKIPTGSSTIIDDSSSNEDMPW